jgi:hypothetical protein
MEQHGTQDGAQEQPTRHALLVYESLFGNTEAIAHAVADGLQERGVAVDLVEVGEAADVSLDDIDLLVVGAPTHAFSLSRPNTRAEAVRQGGRADHERRGVREWLAELPAESVPHGLACAVFDTRATKVRRLALNASRRAGHTLQSRGLVLADRPVGFIVQDVAGPLVPGEVGRATQWGRRLAERTTPRPS